jgi:ABC-type glycerol-3-phosphate transport system permease component
MRKSNWLNSLLVVAATVAFCILILLPLIWGVSTSLKLEARAVTYPPELIPSPFSLGSYIRAFGNATFLTELGNSLAYSIIGSGLAVVVGAPAGYAAARIACPGKGAIMLFILGTAMIPAVALIVPTYLVLDRMGMLNSAIIVIVISAARILPQTVWFVFNFVEGVPRELEDAALVDGATRYQSMRHVVLPLIAPGLAAIFALGLILIWNDYITVAAFAPDAGKRTLQVSLVNQIFDTIGVSWSYTMAYTILASLPVLVIFLAMQRWFVAGMAAGALKG